MDKNDHNGSSSKFSELKSKIILKIDSKCPNLLSEKAIVGAKFRLVEGYDLDFNNPKTYNEKCNWMKVYYHNPLFTTLADKIEVKKHVAKILGEGHTFPIIDVWDDPSEIDFDKLPNQFVLKCNHNSGIGLTICKDKENGIIVKGKSDDHTNLSYDEVRAWLNEGLQDNFYLHSYEWPYKNIKRRIFAEKYMVDKNGNDLGDYKFFCFNGEPKYVWVGTNYTPMHFDVLDINWNNMHLKWGYENSPEELVKPEGFDEMVEVARKLSKGIPHVRIDLFNIGGQIYFGEYTFYTWAGFGTFDPPEWNRKFGDILQLPEKMI